MRELTKDEMLKYFDEINSRLAKENKHGEIIIAGGAALTLVWGARNSTYDIDAIFEPKEDMRTIISDIAAAYKLNADWLNDGVKGFMTEKMGYDKYLELSNLTVHNINAESMLAMKLTSARTNTKDMDDSIFLMKALGIKAEDELFAIIEKYIHPNHQTIASNFFTQEAFGRYKRLVD